MGWWDERVEGFKANADRAAEAWSTATSKRGPATAVDCKADGGSDGSGLGPVLAIVGAFWGADHAGARGGGRGGRSFA